MKISLYFDFIAVVGQVAPAMGISHLGQWQILNIHKKCVSVLDIICIRNIVRTL